MCGLAGFVKVGGKDVGPEGASILETMTDLLAHRGPDGKRVCVEPGVALGFTRLSIVDPVSGDQPLSNADGSTVVIANGEIYNHRELEATLPAGTRMKTRSDCEVLVHLYDRDGVRFLDDVRGIYAIVLWDKRRNRVILARDRFGIKPLYFTRNDERVLFASEIKALFADPATPRELDWHRCLRDHLVSVAPVLDDAEPSSWFKGIELVPAGTVLSVDVTDGAIHSHRYWSLPTPGESPAPLEPAEFVERYRELVAASVRESGMSDAEIGLFLSGGVDSAAVAAFSNELDELHTFTALNGATYANGDGRFAHLVAEHLGRPNHQIVFDGDRVPSSDEWRRLVWLLETPLCGPEQFYKYELHRFARATRPNLKVMLLGQAADEFNGGYTWDLSGGGGWDQAMDALATLARRRALLRSPRLSSWWEADVPAAPSTWQPYELPVEIRVDDWDEEADDVVAALGLTEPLPSDVVPELAPGVLLLRSEPRDGTWYVAIDGSIEYVMDEEEDAEWLRFLRALDGRRSLGDLITATRARPEHVFALVSEAIDVGALVVSPRDASSPPLEDLPVGAT